MIKPVGVTIGDPAGVGPELIDHALGLVKTGPVRLYGPRHVVEDIAARHPSVEPIGTSDDPIVIGQYSKASGVASVSALARGAADLASGAIRSLMTGPISKLALADMDFPGQTEYVASVCGVSRFAMMLAGPTLKVTLATTHVAIKDLAGQLTENMVYDAGELTAQFLGSKKARIAVLGLNPHAGDGGRFGDEEAKIIEPAVLRLKAAGYDAVGPLPADTAFFRAVSGDFDAVVAMYHDQGLGPLKLVHFFDAVNITLGLPRIRVSPDHGPAFDLAGTGKANPKSTVEALKMASIG